MADDAKQAKIQFKVSADGAKETADSLDRVTATLARQQTEVKAVTAANEAAERRYAEFRAEVERSQGVHSQNVVTFNRLGQAANDNAKQIAINSQAVKENAARFAELGGTVSRAFGQVIPAVGQFQGILDPVLRSLSGTLGILGGGGPAGIAAGGVIALVTGLGAAFSAAAKDADALAKETLENAKALGTYMQQIGELRGAASQRFAGYSSNLQRQKALDSGQASGAEYSAEVAAIKAFVEANKGNTEKLEAAYKAGDREQLTKLADIQKELAAAPFKIAEYSKLGSAARARDLGETRAGEANRQDKIEFDLALAEAGGMPDNPKAAKPAKDEAWAAMQRAEANKRAIEAISKMENDYRQKQFAEEERIRKQNFELEFTQKKEQLDKLKAQFEQDAASNTGTYKGNLLEQRQAYEDEIVRGLGELHATDADQVIKIEQLKRAQILETYELYSKLEEQRGEQVRKVADQEKRDREKMTASLMALGTTAAQLTAKQLSEGAKGQKMYASTIVAGIGDAMVAEGVRVMFQGGAQMLLGNYASGGGLLALGAAELAAGLGLGAAASEMPQPPGVGGGKEQKDKDADPIRGASSNGSGDGRGPTVIYIDMPTVVSPSPEDGMRIRQAIDAASRVYGAPV